MNRFNNLARLLVAGAGALVLAACGGEDTASAASTGTVTLPVTSPTATPTPTPTPTATATPTTVSATLIAALNASLDDERMAEATYSAVIQKLGTVAPFVNIIEAERKHISMVEGLYTVRGLDIPENTWEGKGTAADTLQENCAIGVTAEVANIEMYDRLLESITDADVREVFLALQAASRDNHLPAFQRCAG